jgi:hypothetical protein
MWAKLRWGAAALLMLQLVGGGTVVRQSPGTPGTKQRRTAARPEAAAADANSWARVGAPRRRRCWPPRVTRAYERRIRRVLDARRDVWGERLLAAPNGPTYAAARRLLPPVLYARRARGRLETPSGVYYVSFALPWSAGAPRTFGLHLADGSEIITGRVGGPSVKVFVGTDGREPFGLCLQRLSGPTFARGWLPILRTSYRDSAGVRYGQESFVGRMSHIHGLVSFINISTDAKRSQQPAGAVRLAPDRGRTRRWVAAPGGVLDLYAAWIHDRAQLTPIDRRTYLAARAATTSYWEQSLDRLPRFVVPEERVMNAVRALLVQEVEMTWRYSVGNPYEELSFAEGLDVAQVLAAYGFDDVARQILRFTLRKLPVEFTNWRAGERLLAGAAYFQLTRDRAYVREETPRLAAVITTLERALAGSPSGLLPRERYSIDIDANVYSLHGQTLVWQGLLAMSRVWRETGHVALAERSRRLALRLELALRRAVKASSRRLPDGSLFVPTRLLDAGDPFDPITGSRAGTYWNLVAPYALASGFFEPNGPEADGLLRYLRRHGGLLLGVLRAGGRRLSTKGSGRVAGVDQVYGVNLSRFLADQDEPDPLVLSLYGTLVASMTSDTYVTGEAVSIQPVGEELYRSMHLPPNNDGNAAFLETFRLMLVHEVRDASGAPYGLDLAFATPRPWLADGKKIAVTNAPTSFGPVSYTIRREGDTIHVAVEPPPAPPRMLRLRLRVPSGDRLRSVEVNGDAVSFDRVSATIDLSGLGGNVELDVSLARASAPQVAHGR